MHNCVFNKQSLPKCPATFVTKNIFKTLVKLPLRWFYGFMVSVLVGSRPDRVKPKTIKLVFVASPLSTQQRERVKTGYLGIRRMCPSGATCLPADCCISELSLLRFN